ncbi:unnamed protein product [Rotaria sp. Silwood2]|nr:unnamed protein product [Rotaria sp. Silwood2]CAF4579118.1 unnamed protein product [Rotaria sp. Silwood2]
MTISSTINDNEDRVDSQQLQTHNVTVNLFDCLQCKVEIPRCEVEEEVHGSDRSIEAKKDCEIQEFRQEQEIISQQQSYETLSAMDDEQDSYHIGPYIEDYNPMNNYIIIDLPWPESLK